MINKFNEADVVFAVFPQLEKQFRTADANTGYANLYNGPNAGGLITASMVNMGSGYGFRTTQGDYYFDGANDVIQSTWDKTIATGLTLTLSFRITFDVVGVAKGFFGFVNDANNYFVIQQTTGNAIQLAFRLGGGAAQSATTATSVISAGNTYNITVRISNTACKIIVNSTATPDLTIAYTSSVSFTNLEIGSYLLSTIRYTFTGKILAVIVYDAALSDDRITEIHSQMPLMGGGITATDNGNGAMSLAPANTDKKESKYFKTFNSFMSWSKRKLNRR